MIPTPAETARESKKWSCYRPSIHAWAYITLGGRFGLFLSLGRLADPLWVAATHHPIGKASSDGSGTFRFGLFAA